MITTGRTSLEARIELIRQGETPNFYPLSDVECTEFCDALRSSGALCLWETVDTKQRVLGGYKLELRTGSLRYALDEQVARCKSRIIAICRNVSDDTLKRLSEEISLLNSLVEMERILVSYKWLTVETLNSKVNIPKRYKGLADAVRLEADPGDKNRLVIREKAKGLSVNCSHGVSMRKFETVMSSMKREVEGMRFVGETAQACFADYVRLMKEEPFSLLREQLYSRMVEHVMSDPFRLDPLVRLASDIHYTNCGLYFRALSNMTPMLKRTRNSYINEGHPLIRSPCYHSRDDHNQRAAAFVVSHLRLQLGVGTPSRARVDLVCSSVLHELGSLFETPDELRLFLQACACKIPVTSGF